MDKSALSAHEFPVIRVLLVEDSPEYARLTQEVLKESAGATFELTHVWRLSEALLHLENKSTDVVLLDLSLPDSSWPDTLLDVLAKAPDVPVVVFTGFDDTERAIEAVQKGAQDYLVKGELDANLLGRTIRYAIERQRMTMELQALSLTDELTGIYNRRAFLTLGRQQLKMANRMRIKLLVLFADMDGMKWINDTFGHREGDRALMDVAHVLRDTFRESDVIARIGGDEFAVIAVEESEGSDEAIRARLQRNIDILNSREHRPYTLSLSTGIARCGPGGLCRIEDLMESADKMMYEHKRLRKTDRA